MTIRTSPRRDALKADMLAVAERIPSTNWAQSVRRKPEHHTDVDLLQDMQHDLHTIYLQRWSPETRALIVAARAAVDAAMGAAFRELHRHA